jgi:hypothetical protein
MFNMAHSLGGLPLDAIAFCDLIARILYRCLKDQETRTLLFPMVSEHPSTTSPQENSQDVQEMSHA